LKFHPADFKVGLVVKVEDCGFQSDLEKDIFIEMVGKRYNTGKKAVRLTSNRFSNRVENKKYLTLLLERLIAESKKLAAAPLLD
jgi:small subunit ribosomal protein S35